MPQLIDLRSADARADNGPELRDLQNWDPASMLGLILPVDVEPTAQHAQAPLIAIDFPAFNDGRGLSLAVLFRNRYGYQGELRAIGELLPDLFHYYRRCGFDSAALPERYSVGAAVTNLNTYSDYYQASVRNSIPAYRRVARGA